MTDQASTHGHSVKRRRVALACDACRTRKSRCDGRRPKCGMCEDLGLNCVYTAPVTTKNVIVQKDYLSNLEDRVKALEDSLNIVKSDVSAVKSKMSKGSSDEPVKENGHGHQNEQSPEFVETEDAIDAMGAVAFADEKECGFFGASSNIAFLHYLSCAVARSENTQRNIISPRIDRVAFDGGFVNATRSSSPASAATPESRSNMFILPPAEEALTLIHRYFGDTGLLFPYIHPDTIFGTYSELRKGSKKIRRTWLGLLNMILAMAKLTTVSGHSPAENCIRESSVYYSRAFNLCRGEILRGTTLEVVQYLLLMGQYLQGTQKSVQAWTIHGLTVKAALQLGLHSKDASKAFPPLEQEMRKRTWFGCVVLDRVLGMTFGRPTAIPNCYVKLELPTFQGGSDILLTAADKEAYHSIQFFNSTITLYKQMGCIIDQLYAQNLGCGPPLSVGETVSRVLGIETQLHTWVLTLPDSLRLVTVAAIRDEIRQAGSQPQFFPFKFRVILTLRYLHVQILLHRPVLVKFLDTTGVSEIDTSEDRLLNDIGCSSMNRIIESARGIIDIVHELVSSPEWTRNLLGAWWYSLYYTFNAALVIIGATWVHRTRPSAINWDKAYTNIHIYPSRAVTSLYKLNRNRMVDRCRSYLEQLMSALCLQQRKASSSTGDRT
ncbi:C6 transcription factor, putative [Talaromyces stipitatus ATCC 10500]|uniref:C6 transcription factor, putative n=1 Tax=Talaromyces stipitatus (strain ATCC 10500 / CBS 375.48 / QM 6759 / NRRL 1006) TaxID=441959 RepID=B8MB86_TALSN|nr:C6 transcription factor, putative [Talaromyces stipitatus ATCC 10500]EED18875.1 C6 transcription factor, putative [Talaromyces stipitatus ATCC 10500]